MITGEGLRWGKVVRFVHGNGQTAVMNLERGNFVKIRSEAFAVVQKALSDGVTEVAGNLDEQARTEFLDLLNTLRQKHLIFENKGSDTEPECPATQYLQSPKIVYYALSDYCNLTCSFCYADSKNMHAPYRGNTARSLKIIERLASLNVVNLILSGGEPLLREDIFEIAESAKEKNLLVGVTTNGTLVGPVEAARFKNSGVDYVQISIESHVEAEHDSLRGKGTYEKCLDAIRLLKEQGYTQNQLYITATTTRKNIERLKDYAAFAESLGVTPGTSFFQPVGRGHHHKRDLACSEKEMLGFLLSRMEEKKNELTGNCFDMRINQVDDALVPRIINSCGIGHKTLGVKEDGTIVPCHLFFSGRDFQIGNILDDDIVEKLSSWTNLLPTVDGIEECRDCNVRYFCANGCWANVYWAYGNFGRKNPFCNFYKTYFSAVLWNLGMDNAMTRIYDELNDYIRRLV